MAGVFGSGKDWMGFTAHRPSQILVMAGSWSLAVFIGLAGCAANSAANLPVDATAAIEEVERLEREYHRVVANGDRAGQLALLASDYRLVTPFGQTLDRSAVVADVCNFEFLSLSQELQVTLDSNGDAIVTMIAIAVHTTRKVTRELRTTRVWSWRDGRWLARLGQQSSRPGTPPNVEAAAGTLTPGGPDGPACGWR